MSLSSIRRHSTISTKSGKTSLPKISTPRTACWTKSTTLLPRLSAFHIKVTLAQISRHGPLRFQVVRDYVIAYAPDEKPLAGIATLHGRRNPRVLAATLGGRR